MNARKEAELLKFLRYSAHKGTLLESLSTMFERKGLPEDYDGCEGFIDEILLNDGCGAYVFDDVKDHRWVFGSCDLGGAPDAYGFGTIAIITLKNGRVIQKQNWRDDPDVVVCFNTPLRQPDMNITRYSDLFAETETSLVSQLMNSRQHPIPVATSQKMLAAIQEAAADMDAGKLRTILGANLAQEVIETGMKPNEILTMALGDPNASSHIQYISKLLDDLRRWFWQLYGHNPETNGKLAQQSVEEVSSGQSISEILPFAMLKARKYEAEQLKKKFGWDVTIDFAEPWKRELSEAHDEEGGTDNVEGNDESEISDDADENSSESDEV